MEKRIQNLRAFFVEKKAHHSLRQPRREESILAEQFERENTPALERAVRRAQYILEREIPVVFPQERIALMRTVPETPQLFTQREYEKLRSAHWIHESGDFNNFCPNYARVLRTGFDGIRREIGNQKMIFAEDIEKIAFLEAMEAMLAALQDLARRYQAEAERVGNHVVARVFSRIPALPAEDLLEAMQFVRLLNYGLWCANHYQCALGRMDQTLYPYYQKDMDSGRYTREEILSLTEEFFLSFNRDSDLYDGIQQGDNGQSLVLGGLDQDGNDQYNALSDIMLQASLELRLIDPKINLRVSRNTPLERLIKATELTREGLGFPQYLNDDIIIPALLDWGYAPEDACDYAAAACWEPIIPCCGTEIVNADAMNFPAAVLNTVMGSLEECDTYDAFAQEVCNQIRLQADEICARRKDLYVFPAPMASFMMDGCMENAADAAGGCKYQNIGIHGAGISTAADAMAAIQKFVFEERSVRPEELIEALQTNFAGRELLKNRLRLDAPKMGNDDDRVDAIATVLFDAFADALEEKRTETGGRFRPGTASAMYYIWFARDLGATPDGRTAGEPLPANDSPSLFGRTSGPVSVIRSFTKQNLRRVANGGPLTLELHNSVFRGQDSVEKVARLVQLFLARGGHQLQINSVNREDMLQAQKHPENYRNLIVRVWGWSGYFVELDREYQDQILRRTEHTL